MTVQFGGNSRSRFILLAMMRHLKAVGKVLQHSRQLLFFTSCFPPWSSSSSRDSRSVPRPHTHPSIPPKLDSQMEAQQPSASTRSSQHRKLVRKNTLNRYAATT